MLADFQGYRGGHLPGNCLSQYFGIFIWRVKMNAVILLRIVLIAFTICSALFLIVDLIKHKDEIHFKKGITPVSYTHLDVYKRQILMTVSKI